jgi:hypothetical protein
MTERASMTTDVGSQTSKLRRACENCPWRVDAPRGYWDPQHFIDIWRNCQDDGLNVMLCHKSNVLPKEERSEIPCQGWIRVMGFDAIGVRTLVMRGKVTFEEVEDKAGPKLFSTFTAMLKANKIPLPRRAKMVPVQTLRRTQRPKALR